LARNDVVAHDTESRIIGTGDPLDKFDDASPNFGIGNLHRRWKIIEHVREKFSCRDREAITEPPAPSHPIPRICRAGPTGDGAGLQLLHQSRIPLVYGGGASPPVPGGKIATSGPR
jgi:hypothetical protein